MQSRIFRGLLQPLLTVTAIATAVATWETLREVNPRQAELARARACISESWPHCNRYLFLAWLHSICAINKKLISSEAVCLILAAEKNLCRSLALQLYA